jgi:hypothetical protein
MSVMSCDVQNVHPVLYLCTSAYPPPPHKADTPVPADLHFHSLKLPTPKAIGSLLDATGWNGVGGWGVGGAELQNSAYIHLDAHKV